MKTSSALIPMTQTEADAIAAPQIASAVRHIREIASRSLRWPIPALDATTGPLGMGGDVWLVAGATGGGKTAFTASVIRRWLDVGKRVYVMPLETNADRFRILLACLTLEIHPGEAMTGELARYPDGLHRENAVVELIEQGHPCLHVDPQATMDVQALETGLKNAKRWRADVIVIDHIDHVAGGNGQSAQSESQRVCHALLDMAKGNGLLVVATSQLNMDSMKGHDRLGRYQPPQLNHLWMPGVKSQISTGIIGVYRPIRARDSLEGEKEYAEQLRRARAGEVEPHSMLASHTMGIVAMKLRNAGHREGHRVALPFRDGGLRDS